MLEIGTMGPGQSLVLRGDVDVRTVADLRQALHEAIDIGDGDLVVDCADVRLVDATGLGALLGAHRRAQHAGRRLRLEAVQPDLLRLLHASRLSRLLGPVRQRAA